MSERASGRPGALVPLFQVAAIALLAAACRHFDAPEPEPRPSALGGDVLARLRPAHAAFDLELERLGGGSSHDRYRWSAWTYSESGGGYKQIAGEYYLSRRRPASGAGPLIVLAPILGGNQTDYLACHLFGRFAASEGISAFFLYQDHRILAADRDGPALELLLRETTRDNIRALDLFAARPEVDERALGSVGISLGAIRLLPLIAAEPRLRANVLCMGGVDLAGILQDSRERGVIRYLDRRLRREGISRDEVAAELRAWLPSDPAAMLGAIARERVLLVLAGLDDKVPIAYGQQLRRGLGYPETWVMPVGHYTAVAMAPFAAEVGFSWLKTRLRAVRDVPLPGVASLPPPEPALPNKALPAKG